MSSRPKRIVKLPASLDSLIGFQLDFSNLKADIEFLAKSIADNEENLISLTIKLDEEIDKISSRMNKIPEVEQKAETFSKSVEDVYRMKDKVNSWSERFVALEEKYFLMGQQYSDRFSQLESVVDSTIKTMEDKFTNLYQKSTENALSKIDEIEKAAMARIKKAESDLAYFQNMARINDLETRDMLKKEINASTEKLVNMIHDVHEVDNIMQSPYNFPDEDIEKALMYRDAQNIVDMQDYEYYGSREGEDTLIRDFEEGKESRARSRRTDDPYVNQLNIERQANETEVSPSRKQRREIKNSRDERIPSEGSGRLDARSGERYRQSSERESADMRERQRKGSRIDERDTESRDRQGSRSNETRNPQRLGDIKYLETQASYLEVSPDKNNPDTQTNASDQSPFNAKEKIESATKQQGERNRQLIDYIKRMNMRLSEVESKVQNINLRNLLKEDSTMQEIENKAPKSRDELELEMNLKFVTIVTQLNDYKKLMRSFSTTVADFSIDQVATENLNRYIPYISRIARLEEIIESFASRDDIEGVFKELDDLRDNLKEKIDKPEIIEMNSRMSYLEEELNKTRGMAILTSSSPLMKSRGSSSHSELRTEANVAFEPAKFNELWDAVARMSETVGSIQQTLPLKAFRSEFEEVFKLKGSTVSKASPLLNLLDVEERIKQIEDRLNLYWYEMEKQKRSEDPLVKSPQELEEMQHLIEEAVDLHISTIRLELNNRYQELYEIISKPANEGDITNIHILRGTIMKVQRESRDLIEKVAKIEETVTQQANALAEEFKEEEGEEIDPSLLKKLTNAVKKHEALFKIMKDQMSKIYSEIEIYQQSTKKQNEVTINTNIKMFEELRGNVSDVMTKIQEGTRLNQRDMQKINDVFLVLENKGNKEDIMQKVDKNELKKAYRYLCKKIDDLQKKLKAAEEAKEVSKQKDDPTIFRQKLGMECLACGQDISGINQPPKGDWRSWGRFPEAQLRFGPGFSKLLPILQKEMHGKHKSENLTARILATVDDSEIQEVSKRQEEPQSYQRYKSQTRLAKVRDD
ncbi:unnamed protein product [Blepharisma stoltei]|uniref:Uncharacterized protein n=1 Tax=Blepharisma stoltei TaxID=1481888 RepID=A0AAU9JLL0_9CILI|nr:unnamed protein product [Blepharisma stoltei]